LLNPVANTLTGACDVAVAPAGDIANDVATKAAASNAAAGRRGARDPRIMMLSPFPFRTFPADKARATRPERANAHATAGQAGSHVGYRRGPAIQAVRSSASRSGA